MSVKSSAEINTNIKTFDFYDNDTDVFINCDTQTVALIRYFDLSHTDQQNLNKFFFELVNEAATVKNEKQLENITLMLIHVSMLLRKYQQAIDFVHKLQNSTIKIQTLLVLTTFFDFNMKSKDSCLCLVQILLLQTKDQQFQNVIDNMLSLASNNALFDEFCLVLKYQSLIAKLLSDIYMLEHSCFKEQKDISVLYIIDQLMDADMARWVCESDVVKILQHFSMSKKYFGNSQIIIAVNKVFKTIQKIVQTMRPHKKIILLNTLLKLYLNNSGFIFSVIQILILDFTNYCDQLQQIQDVLSNQQLLDLYSNLIPKFLYFNKNVRLDNSIQTTDNIVQLLSVINVNNDQFIKLLLTNFWSQNEYQQNEWQGVIYNEAQHLNKYFAEDILHDIHLIKLYNKKDASLQQYYDDFCFSLLIGFNIKIYQKLKKQQIEDTEMNVGQIYGVSDEIYKFSKQFSSKAAFFYLKFYFQQVYDFELNYVGSEALLFQVQNALDDYVEVSASIKSQIDQKILLDLFESLQQWVEYQIYDVYFEILTQIIQLLQVPEDKDRYFALLKCLLYKLAKSAIQPQQLINQVIQTLVDLEIKHQLEISPSAKEFVVYLVKNKQKIDVQTIYYFYMDYLSALADTNTYENRRLEPMKGILKSYEQQFFGFQNYVYAGQIITTVILYCLLSNGELNLVNHVSEFLEILPNAPKQLYVSICQGLLEAPSIVGQFKENVDLKYIMNLISELANTTEIDALISLIFNIQVEDLTLVTPRTFSRPITSRPQSSRAARIEKPSSYTSIEEFEDFPAFKDIELIKLTVQYPSIPFTFLIPHPAAKEYKQDIDLKELVDDIGTVELNEDQINEFVGQKERPFSSSPSLRKSMQNHRPMSAGTALQLIVDIPTEPEIIHTPKRKFEAPRIRSEEIDDWGEEGVEEENLLDRLEEV